MKNIYIGYSDFTNTLYAFSKKDNSDKQDVSEQFANIVRNVCELNNTKKIKIGNLVLEIKEK
jgi:DNA topoisomerase IB